MWNTYLCSLLVILFHNSVILARKGRKNCLTRLFFTSMLQMLDRDINGWTLNLLIFTLLVVFIYEKTLGISFFHRLGLYWIFFYFLHLTDLYDLSVLVTSWIFVFRVNIYLFIIISLSLYRENTSNPILVYKMVFQFLSGTKRAAYYNIVL